MNNYHMRETNTGKAPLVARGISKTYDDKVILDDISVPINPSDRTAIVGLNGAGKTTLIRILIGEESPDKGIVDRNGLRIGYLRQNEAVNPEMSLYDYITQDIPDVVDALKRYEVMNNNFSQDASFANEYDKLLRFIDEVDGFTLESKIEDLMSNLGLEVDTRKPIGQVSGGELIKAGLIRLLMQRPDILVLDEPTNHLDIYANLWLRDFLETWEGGLLITSHDRDFLNEVVDKTIELEDGRLSVYGGNYDFYLQQKGMMQDAQKREVIRLEKAVKKARKQIERENERAAHSARKDLNKKPDDNDRVRAHYFKERASKTAGRNKDKAEGRVEDLSGNLEQSRLKIEKRIDPMMIANPESYKGRQLIQMRGVECRYPDTRPILRVEELNIRSGDRVAIFGRNGSGKTTLIKLIVNDNSVLWKGEFKYPENLKVVVLDQHYSIVNRNMSVLENLRQYFSSTPLTDIRRHLANFLFSSEDIVNRRAENLSGGEVARLAMAIVTVLPIDLLILDEPTNNLDIHSIEEIEEALKAFSGAILSISHDLSFLQRVGIEESYVITEKKLKRLSDNPTDGVYFREELLRSL